jgi:hypothetical protein
MRRIGVWGLVTAALLVASACVPVAGSRPGPGGSGTANPLCDPIDPRQCNLPFPNNFNTVRDPHSPTGLRLHFDPAAMPKNVKGVTLDPTDWNASDGFSPGAAIMARAPFLDIDVSGIAQITEIGASLKHNAPIVLLDADTGKRVPYWAELDTWNTDPETRALVIRPAKNFREGHRIIVALRKLKDASGNKLEAPDGFKAIRDWQPIRDRGLRIRARTIERVLWDLSWHGVSRHNLYLAWDFTVGSAQGLAGRMLHMRDDAYEQLGSGVPGFEVTGITPAPNSDTLRRVDGTFDVPSYLSGTGAPGSRFVLGPDGLPTRTGTFKAAFHCVLPPSVASGANGSANPGRSIVYGHGLLGSTSEINGHASFANEYNVVICATPEIGMANEDIGNVVNVIADLSTFGSIPDRLQQGILNMQWLARLMKDPRGFGSDPAFQAGGQSVLIPNQVFFNGNSQGGIFGGAATAISKEWTRAVLGVPAINYSTLLPRSVDFDPFLPMLTAAYPDPTLHTLGTAFIQILWDRGEPNGYAQHMTDHPYPGTPKHQVLLIEAFGDHQVANIGTETEARTIGAKVHRPVLAAGRSPIKEDVWGVPPVPTSPYKGSVLEVWDFGTPAPPNESLPPREGSDPHGAARNVALVREQVSQFLQVDGFFIDGCGSVPCVFP